VARQSRKLCSLVWARLLFMAVCLVMQPFPPVFVTAGAYAAESESENLLKNAGFEDGVSGQPAGWTHFLAPADGAEAVWDETVHRSGKRSVRLHIETAYTEEVYNNWYQHVPVVPTAKKLILSGYIRSTDLTDAAIWLQCWRESSQEVVRFATTAVGYPISGTVDWTHVRASIVPPPETAFLTVRCVIAGKGTAWFDDLQLVAEQQRDENSPAKKTDHQATTADQDALKELLEAHKILLEVNRSLAENARLLMEEIGKLRDELSGLKQSIERWQFEQDERTSSPASEPTRVPPFRPATRDKSAMSNAELCQ